MAGTDPIDAGTPTGDAGVVDTGADTGASGVDSSSTTPEVPEVDADTFGWDDWDGTADALPEAHRPWVSKASERYAKQVEAHRAEADNARRIFEALTEGHEDPRIAEYRQKLEAQQNEGRTWQEKHAAAEKQHKEYQAEVDAYFQAQAKAEVDKFKAANSWIFESEELQSTGYDLLDEGFSQNDLPVLLRLPDQVLSRAREINKDLSKRGAKDAGEYALKLARSELSVPGPSKTAALVAGSDPKIDKVSDTRSAAPGGETLDEIRDSSLARHIAAYRR